MTIVYLLVGIMTYGALIVAAMIRLRRPTLSRFELQRRVKLADRHALEIKTQDDNLLEAQTILHIASVVLGLLLVFIVVTACGWLLGAIVLIGLLVLAPFLAARRGMRRLLQRPVSYAATLLYDGAKKYKTYLQRIAGRPEPPLKDIHFASREELRDTLRRDTHHLSTEEKRAIEGLFDVDTTTVASLMKKWRDVTCVQSSELVGPLLLDELHKKGDGQFPVVRGNDTHVVGVLAIDALVALTDKESPRAQAVMNSSVVFIQSDTPLREALAELLEAQQHLAIVRDSSQQVVGAVTLADILRTVFV